MGLHVTLEGHDHPKSGVVAVKVTALGQLVTGPFDYDEVVTKTLASNSLTFYNPLVKNRFVITAMLINANKSVTTDTLVEVYEATSLDSSSVDKSILSIEVLKNGNRDITGLNLRTSEGAFVNAKADDSSVFMTIMGYYVPAT